MKVLFSIALTSVLLFASHSGLAQSKAEPTAAEKALIGAWAGTWTGDSSGVVTFTFVKGEDGKLGGSASPQPTEGEGYTTPFTSVVLERGKVTMKMGTPDGQAQITVVGTIDGTAMKGTYAITGPDGSTVEQGTVAAKKKP